jgi:hypothetical protein
MKDILCILLLSCIALSIALADTIHMKSGFTIYGEIVAVGADSVTIKTASGVVTIAAVDIERIEMIQPQTQPPELSSTEPLQVNASAIPKSIKTVGYGCLGGAILGGAGLLVTILADGFGNGYIASTVIIGSAIIGILLGANMGSK